MVAESYKNNFKKGTTALLILTFLQEGDMYGYQIAQTIEDRSDGAFLIPEGSLYPALYKLIEFGFISDRRKSIGKRMTRVYYHLEDTGREHLRYLTNDYLTTRQCIDKILERSREAREQHPTPSDPDNEA